GADGGCEVDPDAAPAMLPAVVMLLLPVLPVALSMPAERRYDQGVAQLGLSHLRPRWGHALIGRVR
ncbi:hypothetical protein A2U01_0099887, partial [Trifolium medium]|nr:hypothetical protein [Trifolium medium]